MIEYLNAGALITWRAQTITSLTDNQSIDIFGAGAIAHNGVLYFFGRTSNTNQFATYNLTTGVWWVGAMPYSFNFPSCAVYNNEIYIGAGDISPTVNLVKYNPAQNTWTQLAQTTDAYTSKSTLTCVGSKLYLLDRTVDGGPVIWVRFRVYDIPTNTWSIIQAPSVAEGGPAWRFYHGAAALNGIIYFNGGYDWIAPYPEKADLWSYNTITGQWLQLPASPSVHTHNMVCVGSELYLVTYIGITWGYNPRIKKWRQFNKTPHSLVGWGQMTIALDENTFIFGGGCPRYSEGIYVSPGKFMRVSLR